MKRLLIIAGFIFSTIVSFAQALQVEGLRCEHTVNPLGVESLNPKLSWELTSRQQNILQTACRVLVSDDSAQLRKGIASVWDSRKVQSSASIQVSYAGKKLRSAKKYFWKVIVWDNKGNRAESGIAFWQMGLLQPADWMNAKWIGYDEPSDSLRIFPHVHSSGKKSWGARRNVLPLMRKEFDLEKKIIKATAFICGLGQFELYLNGKKIGDHFLDPGWTNYAKTAQYVTFDITQELEQGQNAVGVILGNGFYYIPGQRYRKMTGAYGHPKMIMRILVEYEDGSGRDIISDEGWKTFSSPVIYSSIYGGEDYDAGLEQSGWSNAGFSPGKDRAGALTKEPAWFNSTVTNGPAEIRSQLQDPVKIMQAFEPVTKKKLNDHSTVFDFGQNFSGIPSITCRGGRGDTIRIFCGELLNPDGTVNQRATGSPSYFTYILKGSKSESWMPRFAYTGFRYAQVECIAKDSSNDLPSLLSIRGLHIRNSAATTGSFTCSNELFNKTFNLIKWAINSNMQSLFTDCPHRERLGWQEQLHLMGNALQSNYDIHTLGKKITADIRAEQNANGLVPSTVPEYTEMHFADGYFRDSPEWGSNAILFPWNLYQWYGDKEELAKNYATMQRYMNYLRSRDSSYLLMYGLSDWYDLGSDRPGFCQLTPMGLTATAYYYHDLVLMHRIAALLNKAKDAAAYAKWADTVRQAFNKMYFHPATKQYGSGSQTSNAIAQSMGLVNSKDKRAVIANLVKDIEERNYALTSGDIGFHHLLKALADAGRHDIIYKMNDRSDVPGYGYQLAKGATALTESWQGLPIVSNNHFMLGHLMDWFYSGLAGIQQNSSAVGYKVIDIKPQRVGDINYAKATYHSVYGDIVSEWRITGDIFELNITVPVNTTANVYLPGTLKVIKTGSGNYQFKTKL